MLELVVRDKEVEVAVVVVIPGVDAHAACALPSALRAVPVNSPTSSKAASALVAVQEIRGHVVGDVDVGVPVPVEVAADGAQTVTGIIHSRGGAVVREAPAAVVDEIQVRRRCEPARVAVEPQPHVAPPAPGMGGEVEGYVAGDVKIEVAVVVPVGENRAARPPGVSDTAFEGDVRIGRSVVSQELIGSPVRQVQVLIPVVVVIRGRHTHAVGRPGQAGFPGKRRGIGRPRSGRADSRILPCLRGGRRC